MENKEPLVSVVVPCYNHEKYVKDTIESILNQTYKNIELIVIDDGSKDNSVYIIQKLADKYNFTFINRPNKGLSATLNEGIKLAKGKYFCVCASDDKYLFDKIEKQVRFMENHLKYEMCYAKVIQFNDKESKEIEIKNPPIGFIFDDLINRCFIPAVTVMIRIDIFKKIGLFDENLYIEDWDMWLRIANKYQIGYIDEYLAYYRRHDNNSSLDTLKMYNSTIAILKKWNFYYNYDKTYINNELRYFNIFALEHKVKALGQLQYVFFNLDKLLAWKGIIKLVTPYPIFRFLRNSFELLTKIKNKGNTIE